MDDTNTNPATDAPVTDAPVEETAAPEITEEEAPATPSESETI